MCKTHWEARADPDVAEFLMEHRIVLRDYNRFFLHRESVAKEYLKLLPHVNLLSSDKPFHKVDEDEVTATQVRVRELEA